MRFEFLGHVAVSNAATRSAVRGEQPALVLARVVLERPAPLPREELAEILWPFERPRDWEGPARQVVSRARSAIVAAGGPAGALISRAGRTELHLDHVEVDVEDAISTVVRAEAALSTGTAADAERIAREGIDLLRRPFFGASDNPWIRRWQDRMHAHLLRALHAAGTAALASGAAARAIDLATEALGLDPFDEIATRSLMAAYDATGSRAQALAAYEHCRRRLDDELGVRPSEETEAAYVALLGAPPRERIIAASTFGAPPMPARILPFVGRQAERERIDRTWTETRTGDARAIVIAGEAGIGKTRLASYAADVARSDGGLVLWGTCVADIGLPYQPFSEIVGQLVAARPDLVDVLGPLADDLAALVPELGTGEVRSAPDELSRARLFRAVDTVLAALDEPLSVVVDDLQWAGADALALLRHATVSLPGRPRLLVITARECGPAGAAALADVQRRIPTVDLQLRGLSVADLGELLEGSGIMLGDEPRAVAASLAERTTGNPFFVTQLLLDAGAADSSFDPVSVPEAVAVFVERRLDALPRPASAMLALAAVAGDEIDIDTFEACSPSKPDELLGILEDMCRQRFLEERAAGSFRFVHALVRDAVLTTIGQTRRQRLHRRLADTLAQRGADAAVVAHHYAAAGSGAAEPATRWLLRAGRAALEAAAWSDAAQHFERALALVGEVDDRCHASTGLGRARRALGDATGGRVAIEAALALAQTYRRGRAAAEAGLALVGGGGRGVAVDLDDAERTNILRSVLDGLTGDDVDLLVPTLGELALSLVLTDAKAERDALAERCVIEARRSDDPDLLASALLTRRIALMGPAGTRARVEDAREALAFAPGSVAPERVLAAHLALVEDLIELGDRPGVDRALAAASDLAARLAHPYWSWATASWAGLMAIVDGRLDDAEELAFAALAHQAPAEHPEATAALGVNLVDIRLFQGRAAEVVELLRVAAGTNPQIPCYRAVLALCCAESGDGAGAREAYDAFATTGFALPPDSNWLLSVAVLADVAATLGDAEGGAALADLLQPYADRHVVLNCFGGGGAYWGPVAHHLGRLSALVGDDARAEAQLDDALRRATAFGAKGFLGRTEQALTTR